MSVTNVILDPREEALNLVDVGLITERDMLIACLKYMSKDDVADMLITNDFLENLDDE